MPWDESIDLRDPLSDNQDNEEIHVALVGVPGRVSQARWPNLARKTSEAIPVNAPLWRPGPTGEMALRFNGSTQYAAMDTDAIPIGSTTYAVAARVRYTSEGIFLACRNSSDSSPIMWQLDVNGGSLRMIVRDDSGVIAVASGGSLSTGRWYDVAGVRNGNNVYAYLNGVLVGTASNTFGTINNVNNSLIGAANAGGLSGYLAGDITSVRLFHRALDAAAIGRLTRYGRDPSIDPRFNRVEPFRYFPTSPPPPPAASNSLLLLLGVG